MFGLGPGYSAEPSRRGGPAWCSATPGAPWEGQGRPGTLCGAGVRGHLRRGPERGLAAARTRLVGSGVRAPGAATRAEPRGPSRAEPGHGAAAGRPGGRRGVTEPRGVTEHWLWLAKRTARLLRSGQRDGSKVPFATPLVLSAVFPLPWIGQGTECCHRLSSGNQLPSRHCGCLAENKRAL